MIYDRTYVKALIKKRMTDQINPMELDHLKSARKIFSDEEFDEMVAEVMLQLKDADWKDSLADWKPDFEAIRITADKLRIRKRQQVWWQCGTVAAVILVVLIGVYFVMKSQHDRSVDLSHAGCAEGTHDKEIPLSESAGSIIWGDSSMMYASTDQGELLRSANMALIKSADGLLKIVQLKSDARGVGADSVVLITGALQQCVVELPNKVHIRLSAQSRLRYAMSDPNSTNIHIEGEALVKIPDQLSGNRFVIHTGNGQVTSQEGEFEMVSYKTFTRTTLARGELVLRSNALHKDLKLSSYNEVGIIKLMGSKGKVEPRDSLISLRNGDFKEATQWTKVVREYRNVPLSEFVWQMSRWQGFTVRNMNCIPTNKTISTSVCYKMDREQVYATIRDAGVLLYEQKGMVSFCPEKDNGGRGIAMVNK